jgi:uncharacterized protein YbaA (DUF1428 family)
MRSSISAEPVESSSASASVDQTSGSDDREESARPSADSHVAAATRLAGTAAERAHPHRRGARHGAEALTPSVVDRKGADRLAAVASNDATDPSEEAPVPYIEGFVAAVPTANRDVYIEHAKQGAEYFKNLGATRVTECWGDDVPRGEVTDFFRATQAKDDETVVFSWIEYPDKATRDAANEKMSADAEAMQMEMPFDGSRMFWGGFQPVLDE